MSKLELVLKGMWSLCVLPLLSIAIPLRCSGASNESPCMTPSTGNNNSTIMTLLVRPDKRWLVWRWRLLEEERDSWKRRGIPGRGEGFLEEERDSWKRRGIPGRGEGFLEEERDS